MHAFGQNSLPSLDAIRAEMARRGLKMAAQESKFARYQQDPVAYAKDVLRAKLTDDQAEMLNSVRDNRYTAVKASHAVGKTFLASVAANWWYDCWNEHIVYVTAPNWSQALGLTFKQVKRARRALNLPGRILDSGKVLDTDLSREPAHFIRALNADTGEGFQGEHSAPILIVMEEAVGVPAYIWEAAGGLMTHPDNRLLAIGNPTDEATHFGQACEAGHYSVLSISALDHPNIEAELRCAPPPFPDAVRLQWLYEMLVAECEAADSLTEDAFEFWALEAIKAALEGKSVGSHSPRTVYQPTAYFQGRVLGEFPTQADEQVIPKGWLRTQGVLQAEDALQIGCDVARFGDDRTTIFARRGPVVLKGRELRKMDTVAVEGAIKDMARELAGDGAKKIAIKIDVTGGLGAGPYDHLKAEGYSVVAVNSSEKAKNEEQFKNKRSELWFDVRERAREKRLDLSRLPKELRGKLIRELSAPKYKVKSGKKVVEEKADIKKRLGYSPDLADGLNLAFAPASDEILLPQQSSSIRRWQ